MTSNSSWLKQTHLDTQTMGTRVVFFLKFILLIYLAIYLSGCAQAPKVLRYDPYAGESREEWPVWPRAPEVPRFIYAGQLTGEQNFLTDGGDSGAVTGNLLAWLIGIGQEELLPTVLQRPQGGMVDAAGRIYVTDVSRQAVFVFDKVAGSLKVWGFADKSIRFRSPIGIAQGAKDSILVSDADLGYVAILDINGNPVGRFGKGVLDRPTGLARDAETGTIYVADTKANDIKVFNDQGELLDTIGYEGDKPGALNSPTYLTLSKGLIYVTDTLNSRIQIYDTDGNYIRHFGKRGVYLGNFSRPKGVAVDSNSNVYVIESYYDHLLIYDNDGQFLLPIGGTGNGLGQFYLPAGVWVDDRDRVYVADMFNGRVVIFQPLGEGQ